MHRFATEDIGRPASPAARLGMLNGLHLHLQQTQPRVDIGLIFTVGGSDFFSHKNNLFS
jgi:hypothetical protein